MGPDRIRAWLGRVPKGGERIQIVFEALGNRECVASWSSDELAGGDGAQLVLDACQEHCDDYGSPTRYSLQWVDATDKPLQSKVIKCSPQDGEDRSFGRTPEDATAAGVLGQVLRHQEVMARMYVGAQSGVLANMQQLLSLQARQIETMQVDLKEAQRRVRAAETKAAAQAEGTEEAAMVEAQAKADAWGRVSEALAAHVVPLAAAQLAGRMNGAS